MARRNDSLRCSTRLRSTSVNRMRSGRPMPRRRTSSTSSLRSMEWPLPSAWTVTFPLSLMPKYPAPQLRTPYVSKASARDQGCGGEVGIVRSGPPGVPVAREPGTIEEHGEASTPRPVALQRHPCDAATGVGTHRPDCSDLPDCLEHLIHVPVDLHLGPHPGHLA